MVPLNHYPLWKYLLILFVIIVAALYALPNLYPNVPAIQISHESGELSETTFATLQEVLQGKTPFKSQCHINEDAN